MRRFLTLFKLFSLVCLSLLLASCSLLNWFEGGESSSQPAKKKIAPVSAGWNYSKLWLVENAVPPIPGVIDNDTMTLSGQCSFTPELSGLLTQQKKGLLVPVLEVADDYTLAPNLDISGKLYTELKQPLRLAGVGDSLSFYQTLLASIEHNCPANMTRDIDSCQLKKWISFTGFGASNRLYDVDRVHRWYQSHKSVSYLIISSSELFNSTAMLNARYAEHSKVITKQSEKIKNKSIRPFVGHVRFDWVFPKSNNKSLFESKGMCKVSWVELEKLRHMNGASWQGTDKLIQSSRFLMPYAVDFMNRAIKTLPLAE